MDRSIGKLAQLASSAIRFSTSALTGLLLLLVFVSPSSSQEAKEAKAAQPDQLPPIAKLITLTSPVDDRIVSRVQTAALALQNQSTQENRRAVLVLQVTPGSSKFSQVQELAKILTSAELSRVMTVAWVPETVTGNNVVLALACKEIVMHPDAEIGDIGRGKPLDQIDQQFILSLAEKRHNRKLNAALVRGLMDPQVVLLKIQKQIGPADAKETETQIVTVDELKRLVGTGAIILKNDTILEAGISTFSGVKARAQEILIVQTAESLRDLASAYHIPPESLRENTTEGTDVQARLIVIREMIEPKMAALIQRQITRAVEQGANLLIFDINSPGGFLETSESLANTISYLDPQKVRTVAFIGKDQQAISGAAVIALGCDEIYIHPDAKIGDAGPIEIKQGQWFEHAPEKVLSTLRITLSELAERKKRPPALAMAMADRKLEVYKVTHRDTGRVWFMSQPEIDAADGEWIKKEKVLESGGDMLLTVSGKRATELKLAERTVNDMTELRGLLGIPDEAELAVVGRNNVDNIIEVLNTGPAMAILITLGIVCFFCEAHFMTGLLGIIGTTCFALVFWSRVMGGTAGWLEILLFVLGMACIAMEIFVIPGFGVFGISGGLLVLTSLILASQTFELSNGGPSSMSQMTDTLKTLSASAIAVMVLLIALNRFLPKVRLFNQMVLTPPGATGLEDDDHFVPRLKPAISSGAAGGSSEIAGILVGSTGKAVSILRPAGKANIEGRIVDVVSNGAYIEKGATVEVLQVAGNRIVVREA